MSLRIAVLLSGRTGRGSNMQAIAEACADGRIDGSVVLVLGNHAKSPALERARSLGIPTSVVRSPARSAGPSGEAAYAEALGAALEGAAPDLICLAGYVRKLPDTIVATYSGRIMNIHNALLPSFGGQGMFGLHVHQAVLDYGVKLSGCTVHFVNEHYDAGPIILQIAVPVREEDTAESLAARVLSAEHEAYPKAVLLFAQKRLSVHGRRVFIS